MIMSEKKRECLESVIKIFREMVDHENNLKERLQDKIQEINDMRSYVVDSGWLFRELVEDGLYALNDVTPYPQVACKNISDYASLAMLCVAVLSSKTLKNNESDYFSLVEDMIPVTPREQIIKPLEKYVRVCDENIKYFNGHITKIQKVLEVGHNKGSGKE